jgi:hypothetical protein
VFQIVVCANAERNPPRIRDPAVLFRKTFRQERFMMTGGLLRSAPTPDSKPCYERWECPVGRCIRDSGHWPPGLGNQLKDASLCPLRCDGETARLGLHREFTGVPLISVEIRRRVLLGDNLAVRSDLTDRPALPLLAKGCSRRPPGGRGLSFAEMPNTGLLPRVRFFPRWTCTRCVRRRRAAPNRSW